MSGVYAQVCSFYTQHDRNLEIIHFLWTLAPLKHPMRAVTEVFFDLYDTFIQDLANAPEFAVVQRQVADLIRGKIVVGRLCMHVGSMFFLSPLCKTQAP